VGTTARSCEAEQAFPGAKLEGPGYL